MNEQEIISLIQKAGDFELKNKEELDNKISYLINNTESKNSLLEKFFITNSHRIILTIIIILFIFLSYLKFYNKELKINKNEFYNKIISQILYINDKKDVNLALNIYGKDFFNVNNKAEIKKNIEQLFKNYNKIIYKPQKENVIVNADNALIENKIDYYATSDNRLIKPISMKGKDRIYLKKYNKQWKIIAWVYEENK